MTENLMTRAATQIREDSRESALHQFHQQAHQHIEMQLQAIHIFGLSWPGPVFTENS